MRSLFKKIFRLISLLLVLPWIYGVALNYINPPITLTQLGSMVEGYGLQRDYLSDDEMPTYAKWALVGAEDQRFALHSGFDLEELEKIIDRQLENKTDKPIRGGSTISQQVAKNVFLWQGRSWVRKGLEAYCTFVLEKTLSKNRILSIYLNIAEMGQGTFGFGAAAQYYFKKPAQDLTQAETAQIIAALPSPKKYNVNPPSAYISKRSKWIQRQVRNLKGNPALAQIIENKQ